MENCIFCKIIRGEIPSEKVYEDDMIYAFRDINPQMPTHVLIVPKEHIASANEVTSANAAVVAHIFDRIKDIAAILGVKDAGYRIINNCGKAAGQTVAHLHFHLLAGADMGEKLV